MLCNTTVPDSNFKKKCQSIAYNLIFEGVENDEGRKANFNTN